MATEKLIIKNFAGFEYIEFDFKPINIFIGPQASGKSIVIKLAYYFKSFLYNISNSNELYMNYLFLQQDVTANHIFTDFRDQFLKYFPEESWGKSKFEITFYCQDLFIKFKKTSIKHKFRIEFSDTIEEIIEEHLHFVKEVTSKKQVNYLPMRVYENEYNHWKKYQYFIPAGRSFFTNIRTNIFSILDGNNSLDPFLIKFGRYYEQSKQKNHEFNSFSDYAADVLKGNYLRENDNDNLIHTDKRKVNLANASSGQQEIFPLLIVLQDILTNDKNMNNLLTRNQSNSLYIEEPEAHLFPNAQKKIVQLFAYMFNLKKDQIFITTHSPYILAAFNNLIEAGNIIKEKPHLDNEVYNIIPKEEVLNSSDVIAYSIEDGEKTVLIDDDSNLISQNVLDNVSNEISEEFGKLVDLEFGEE